MSWSTGDGQGREARDCTARLVASPSTQQLWNLNFSTITDFSHVVKRCGAVGEEVSAESWPRPTCTARSGLWPAKRAAGGDGRGEGRGETVEIVGAGWERRGEVVLESTGYLIHRTRAHVSFAAAQLSQSGRDLRVFLAAVAAAVLQVTQRRFCVLPSSDFVFTGLTQTCYKLHHFTTVKEAIYRLSPPDA